MSDLTDAAGRWGIESEFFDVFGHRSVASPDTVRRLIDAMAASGATPRALAPPAPMRAYQGDGRRLWALAVHLYALRSRRNWGIGDFSDLATLIALAAARGAAAVGLNPLHALFADRAEDASPYAPNSRLFLNPLYIDVEAIPEFPGCAELAAEVAALCASELVAYARVADVKLRGLRLAHRAFRQTASAARRADLESYLQVQGETLLRFACFEVLRRQYAPAPWWQWPQAWRNPERAQLEDFRRAHDEDCEFTEFVQWTADRQLAACVDDAREHGMPIGLYTDLAVGIDRSGADAWSTQQATLAGVSIGAPPDELNRAGQDWGLAPFNPHALPDDDFAMLRQLMRANMRHAGALRIDHVLGLQRLFMIPHGGKPGDGAYVRLPFEPLLRVIAEESERARCIVIGEDLGTVPDGFRDTLARWGLCCYRVMLFERDGEGRFRPPESYPPEALATFGTHDLPTYQGWREAHDLRVKRALGLDPGENDQARAWAQQCLREALTERAPVYPPGDVAALAAFLAATPSRLAVVSIEDVLGLRDQVNIPGTVAQHPNWRRRLPVALEELEQHDGLRRVGEAFAQAGRAIR